MISFIDVSFRRPWLRRGATAVVDCATPLVKGILKKRADAKIA